MSDWEKLLSRGTGQKERLRRQQRSPRVCLGRGMGDHHAACRIEENCMFHVLLLKIPMSIIDIREWLCLASFHVSKAYSPLETGFVLGTKRK